MALCHYKLVGVLGSGNYGTVYSYKDTTKQEGDLDYLVAVKRIPLRPLDPSVRTPNPLLEAQSQKRLNHPHIVRLIRGYRDDAKHELLLVLEYCHGGDLKHFMRAVAPLGFGLPMAIVQRFTAEMVSALLHLRRHRTFHRDLKAENILLSSNDPSTADVKISDFGFAKTIAEDIDPLRIVQTACGTPLYMAPERCLNQPYSFESDIWSAGLIVFEMAFGKHLFRHCKTLPQLIAAQKDVYQALQLAIDAKDGMRKELEPILVGMLEYDPSRRLSLVGIAKSVPWLSELLCYNEDLRYLVQQEKGDESWLRDLGPGCVPQTGPPAPSVASCALMVPGSDEDEACNISELVELAPEVGVAMPSAQPPGYRAMAGHALLWCQQKMAWMLQPFSANRTAAD
jgi:serine/threonine protein kinase